MPGRTTQSVRPNDPVAAHGDGLVAVHARVLEPVLDDLELELESARALDDPPRPPPTTGSHAVVGVPAETQAIDALAPAILAFADTAASADGCLFVFLLGARRGEEIAALRNRLWPGWHVSALYAMSNTQVTRTTLEETRDLHRGCGKRGTVMFARRRAVVLAPETTVAKFDRNARGWNGEPGRPGYRHFRWMRRFVAEFAGGMPAQRILDFGCGAGWVGIEAALIAKESGGDPVLCAFDPSPGMVAIAGENARAEGLTHFEARTGFGERPPFGAAAESGAARFDLTLSSGVISFADHVGTWLDGLVSTLAPGATLVIGDIHRESKGMRRRRAQKPLLPVREMNALVREEVREELERRGLVFEAWCGYQLSDPMPQLLHFSQMRLGGAFEGALLRWNERASRRDLAGGSRRQDEFDSWVMRMRAPR
jgi:SAM-dependent methyltransferase